MLYIVLMSLRRIVTEIKAKNLKIFIGLYTKFDNYYQYNIQHTEHILSAVRQLQT